MNLIVTAKVGAGKTTWCRNYGRWLVARGLTAGGVLCPEVRKNGTRIGYDVVDILTGRGVMFARLASEAQIAGELVGNYLISHAGLEFAESAIKQAIAEGCDVVFIDEVGHLELAGKGNAEPLKMAYQKAKHTTVVVRRSLLTSFLEYLHLTVPQVRPSVKDLELDTSYPQPEAASREWICR